MSSLISRAATCPCNLSDANVEKADAYTSMQSSECENGVVYLKSISPPQRIALKRGTTTRQPDRFELRFLGTLQLTNQSDAQVKWRDFRQGSQTSGGRHKFQSSASAPFLSTIEHLDNIWRFDFSHILITGMEVLHRQAMDVDNAPAAEMEARSAVRSCTICSKAKAKCVKAPGQQTCER